MSRPYGKATTIYGPGRCVPIPKKEPSSDLCVFVALHLVIGGEQDPSVTPPGRNPLGDGGGCGGTPVIAPAGVEQSTVADASAAGARVSAKRSAKQNVPCRFFGTKKGV
jgi:hypothetical protein